MRSSGVEPVTGPGDADRDKKGDGVLEGLRSLAPSTRRGIAGDGGLLVAEEVLLPASLPSTISTAPSLCPRAAEGMAGGLPDGVPN
jgi:hypothetical protein